MKPQTRAPRNRTLIVDADEQEALSSELLFTYEEGQDIKNRILCGDALAILQKIPHQSVDLIVADPPYNKTKAFNGRVFRERDSNSYQRWMDAWVCECARVLKKDGTIYVCSDWQSSLPVQLSLQKHFTLRNRITWEREKGRGAAANWKNCSEDIWFGTKSDQYFFDAESVRLRRRVVAPYKNAQGMPKGWDETEEGQFRMTAPSNLWTDISVPFWSMPENTDHPTQKPEKLVAKLILASSRPKAVVLDPFLGSGTTAVAAKKLGRSFIGIEYEEAYCRLAIKRLRRADKDNSIQGYKDGVFVERNTLMLQEKAEARQKTCNMRHLLFEETCV